MNEVAADRLVKGDVSGSFAFDGHVVSSLRGDVVMGSFITFMLHSTPNNGRSVNPACETCMLAYVTPEWARMDSNHRPHGCEPGLGGLAPLINYASCRHALWSTAG